MAKAEIKMNGKISSLDYDGYSYSTGSTGVTSLTFQEDHDMVLLVTSNIQENTYTPTYNGVTYKWKLGNKSASTMGGAVLIPHVEAGTSITFSQATRFDAYGCRFS